MDGIVPLDGFKPPLHNGDAPSGAHILLPLLAKDVVRPRPCLGKLVGPRGGLKLFQCSIDHGIITPIGSPLFAFPPTCCDTLGIVFGIMRFGYPYLFSSAFKNGSPGAAPEPQGRVHVDEA